MRPLNVRLFLCYATDSAPSLESHGSAKTKGRTREPKWEVSVKMSTFSSNYYTLSFCQWLLEYLILFSDTYVLKISFLSWVNANVGGRFTVNYYISSFLLTDFYRNKNKSNFFYINDKKVMKLWLGFVQKGIIIIHVDKPELSAVKVLFLFKIRFNSLIANREIYSHVFMFQPTEYHLYHGLNTDSFSLIN